MAEKREGYSNSLGEKIPLNKIKFIRIVDKIVNMDEIESIEHTCDKVIINLNFDTKEEHRIKIIYKSGRVDIIPLENKEAGDTLMEDINANIKRWNVENGK